MKPLPPLTIEPWGIFTGDSRKSRRKSVSIPCSLAVMGRENPGRIRDLSSVGAFVQTAQASSCGDEVSINFTARQQGRPVRFNLAAKVVYVGRFVQTFDSFWGIGARFASLSSDDLARLNNILDSLEPEPKKKYELTGSKY